jgi:hypothetical protein
MRRVLLVLVGVLLCAAAHAQEDDVSQARALFTHGAELVQSAQWSEALASFEQSAAKRPHPITTYNIAQCERALGRYKAAREHFARSLADGETSGLLPASLAADAHRYAGQLEQVLVHAKFSVTPVDAHVAIDGHAFAPPLNDVILDPGNHVITLSHEGYADGVISRTFAPGAHADVTLDLDRLPAHLHVSSNEVGAIVTVSGYDVGAVPVDVSRPAGTYRVVVKKQGFDPYEAQIHVNAGQDANLRAPLAHERVAITKRWWFWTIAAALVTGAAVTTYFLARTPPTPVRPPPDGGGLGWVIKLP